MQSRSSTTGLMMDTPHMIHNTVGVLSDTDQGVALLASVNAARRIASRRTRLAISRLKLVNVTPELVFNTKASVI